MDAIKILSLGDVSELSLDHDLGDDEKGTGYTILVWIERMVIAKGFTPPNIYIHTSNVSAKVKMVQAVQAIEKLHKERSNND